jgi:flagellar motility protein MotE (MotC chaperone)
VSLIHIRLLPFAIFGMLGLLAVKLDGLWRGATVPVVAWVTPAAASASARAETPRSEAPRPETARVEGPRPEVIRPEATRTESLPAEATAERAVLEALRARRAEIEQREALLAEREMLLAAAERRISARLEELAALQSRLEGEVRMRDERTEQGWRQMVRTFEVMRPRDAAGIFDELDMPVLLQVLDRMREARAAPILAAMRTERARTATTELARHRSRAPD